MEWMNLQQLASDAYDDLRWGGLLVQPTKQDFYIEKQLKIATSHNSTAA